MSRTTPYTQDRSLAGSGGARMLMMLAAIAGVGGIALSIALAWWNINDAREQFYRAYLTSFSFGVSICLGALFFILIQHATRAGWSVVIRRIAECVAGNLMWIWVLFIPILYGMNTGGLYNWTDPEAHNFHGPKYEYWLIGNFWTIRAVIYLAVWALIAWYFVRHSVAQDRDGDIKHTLRMQSVCYPAIALYGLTQSFAAMDWIMSLESQWFSTMFPVYFFAASACGYFAVQIIGMWLLQRSGRLLRDITPEHYQDAGKLLFAFGIVFWAYIAFSQYMLIWYANLPEETGWYMARQLGPWMWISLLLLLGHFAGPFVAIISRHIKRMSGIIVLAAGWMLLMHYVDVSWLVKPVVPEAMIKAANNYAELSRHVTAQDVNYGWGLVDVASLVGVAGLITAGTLWRMGSVSLVPSQDPRLHESLAFENM